MHIPDGYLGPKTYGTAYALMVPIWVVASRFARKSLTRRQIPLIALGAAFCFVVMFLNVPVFGRLSAHPLGAAVIAILCGPWAACIAISAALFIQAGPFGDGGITTYAANCLNLAVIAPFVSWWIFKLIQGRNDNKKRLWFSSAVAGYTGVVAASIAVGVEVGLQSHLSPGMYLPYSIKTAVLAMLIPHMLIIGPLEGLITAAALSYMTKRDPKILTDGNLVPWSVTRRLAAASVFVVLLAPLGIIVPKLFDAGSAWGEWSSEELHKMFGQVPQGIVHGSRLWRPILPDYAPHGQEPSALWIIIIAMLGGAATVGIVMLLGRLLSRGKKDATT